MLAWTPERGSSTPTLSALACARPMAGAATSVAAAPAVAKSRRRLSVVERELDI
jgi:hypothetical protein